MIKVTPVNILPQPGVHVRRCGFLMAPLKFWLDSCFKFIIPGSWQQRSHIFLNY